MSSIDQRIVQMNFDNAQFERGIQTSVKSLSELKKGLNLDAQTRSLSELGKIGKSINFNGLLDSVSAISSKFSTMGIVAVTALQNIVNTAVDAGRRIVSALTMDPVMDGYREYEMMLNAVQTTMAGTGKSLGFVEEELKKLDEYADKTIYSTSDMLTNLPKFTNAGVELTTAVTAMKGIANATALAGGNAQQAGIAFYNLGQSIGGGYLTRMDYNSLNLAGSATLEWKNRMVEAAIAQGTLAKAGEDQYSIDGKLFTLQNLFIEGLQERWASTDVLLKVYGDYGDVTTDIGKRAQAAAQDLRSFTMLMESLKASVATGWKDTWQLIFGDINEAKKFWTPIGEYIMGANKVITEQRNNLLKGWKDEGGQIAFFDGLRNAVKAFELVLKPVGEAFKQIFPPITAITLIEISQNFRDLMDSFKIGEETAGKIKRTFAGVFAILDIGRMIISSFVNSLVNIINYLSPARSGLLSITASAGDYIVKFRDMLKTTDAFNTIMGKVGNGLKTFFSTVKDTLGKAAPIFQTVFDTIAKFFKDFASIDTSGLDTFGEKMKARFEPFSIIGKIAMSALGLIVTAFQKAFPLISAVGRGIGKAVSKLHDTLIKAFDTAEYDGIVDAFNAGSFVLIVVGIKKFIDSIKKIADSPDGVLGKFKRMIDSFTSIPEGLKGVLKGVTGVLDGVKNTLVAYQQNIKANILLKIATAMALLTASIVALSLIDSKKLATSLGAMTTMFVELFGSMAVFEKTMGAAGFLTLGKLTTAMIALSAALLLLTFSVTRLAKLDAVDLAKGLYGVAAMMAMLVGMSKMMEKNTKNLTFAAVGFTVLGVSLLILTQSVKQLGALDIGSLAKGLLGLGVLLGELVLFSKLMKTNAKSFITTSVSLTILGAALLIMGKALSNIGSLSLTSIGKGLLGLAGSLGIMVAALKLMPNMTKNTTQIVILASAMLILSNALIKMGGMSWGEVARGLTTLAGAMTVFTVSLKFMEKAIPGAVAMLLIAPAMLILAKALQIMVKLGWEEIGKGMTVLAGSMTIFAVALSFMDGALPGAAAMLVVAPAMVILAEALNKYAKLTWEEIGRSMTVLAGSMTILAAGLTAMSTSPQGAAGLLIAAYALTVLAPVLKSLGEMKWTEIAKGLAALAGLFILLGVAGMALGPLVPTLVGLGLAITLIGAGCMAAGAGLLLFASGLTALSISGVAGSAALVTVMTTLLNIIPLVVKQFVKGLLDMVKLLADYAPEFAKSIIKIMSITIDSLKIMIPKFVDLAIVIVSKLLDAIGSLLPKIIETGLKIIKGILKGIDKNIKGIGTSAINIVTKFIDTISSKIDDVIQAGYDFIISFINGLADAIDKNTGPLNDAIRRLIKSMISAAIKTAGENTKKFKTAGTNMVKGLIKGIENSTGDLLTAVGNMASSAIKIAEKVLDINSPSKVFESIGENIMNGLIKGVDNKTKKSTKALQTSMDAMRAAGQKTNAEMAKDAKKAARDNADSAFNNAVSKYAKTSEDVMRSAAQKETKKTQKKTEKDTRSSMDAMRDAGKKTNKEIADDVEKAQKKVATKTNNIQKNSAKKATNTATKASNEQIDIAKEEAKTKEEIRREEFEKSKAWIDEQKYYNKLSLEDELAAWNRVRDRYEYGTEEYKEAAREIYRVQNEIYKSGFENSKKWIDKEKYYKRLSLQQELAAWNRVRDRYKYGTEEYIEADREIFRTNEELKTANVEYTKAILDIEKNVTAERKRLSDEYYQHEKDINLKLIQDIQAVENEYKDAIYSRSDAIVGAYGLFDAVPEAATEQVKNMAGELMYWTDATKKATTTGKTAYPIMQAISGQSLLDNLEGQVTQLETWKLALDDLRNKGVTKSLINDLQEMGPQSLAQIQALNRLNKYELNKYEELYEQKRGIATTESIIEMDDMRKQADAKIQLLKEDADTELQMYQQIWYDSLNELQTNSNTQLEALKKDWIAKVGDINTETEKEFKDLTRAVDQVINKDMDWVALGINISKGVQKGIESEQQNLGGAIVGIANVAKATMEQSWGIASPSKEFAKIGAFAIQGLINGLQNNITKVTGTSKNVASSAKEALRNTLSNMSSLIDDGFDMVPTIRPVLDLSDVNKGLDSAFYKRGISVSGNKSKLTNVNTADKTNRQNGISNNTTNMDNRVVLNVSYSVRNEDDIRKNSQELNKTLTKYNRARGVQT